MKIGFVMDPLEHVNVLADTTFALMLAARARGHELFYIRPEDLAAEGDEAFAHIYPVAVRPDPADKFTLGAPVYATLHTLDCVMMRKDPPFDVAYLYDVALLELAQQKGCLILNSPRGLRDANEKLYALHFKEAIPTTIVTNRAARIKAFMAEQGGRCVLKPLDGHGGSGVLVVEQDDRNLNALIEISTDLERRPVMCQAYIAAAREGDKRIIMLNGKPLGAILRVPLESEHRSNIHVGGRVHQTTLSERDQHICAIVGPRLVQDGLFFVGLDVIGGHLTEVNVTSPTGIQELGRLNGFDAAGEVIAAIEDAHGRHRQ
ncbi:MAG: glutathione synthase [Bradymonadaceae bacterium]|nr:glutathione synthase [Lujinxingiaceae bacterium]